MKILMICLSFLVFFTGCQSDTTTTDGLKPEMETIQDPLLCRYGGPSCQTDWIIEKSSTDFPRNIEIKINDASIYNECTREGNASVTRALSKVSMTIWNYLTVKASTKFKLELIDLSDCYSPLRAFYSNAVQGFELKTNSEGDSEVLIKL